MADPIIFLVQGSEAEPYEVSFRRAGNNVTAECTCAAGGRGLHCKHRLRILCGVEEGIVSENTKQIPVVLSWLDGTDVGKAVEEMVEAEVAVSHANSALKAAKKRVAEAMMD